MINEIYDVIIIGGGPGGLTAAIYSSRANLKTIFIEKGAPGGKVVKTNTIENWTGDRIVKGPTLALRMFEHAKAFGAEYKYGNVIKIINNKKNKCKEVKLGDESILKSKSIIIATGLIENVPIIENIHKFQNKGVSYCAICDGPLFKNKHIGVIGGGNSAFEEAIYLSTIASHITLFIRNLKDIYAEKKIQDQLKTKKNVNIIINSEIIGLYGKNKLEWVKVKINNQESKIQIDALFPYIGQKPVSSFAKHLDITNKKGFIKTNELMETTIKGIYAIGDVRFQKIKQIANAVSDGVIAAKSISDKN